MLCTYNLESGQSISRFVSVNRLHFPWPQKPSVPAEMAFSTVSFSAFFRGTARASSSCFRLLLQAHASQSQVRSSSGFPLDIRYREIYREYDGALQNILMYYSTCLIRGDVGKDEVAIPITITKGRHRKNLYAIVSS